MHPLNGVSTQRGENMRETCARVLAAALLTGAIATVVGMAALADAPQEPTRIVAAPASWIQRTVRLKVRIVARRRRSVRPAVTAHISYGTPRPAVVVSRLIVVRTHRASPQPRQRRLASVPAAPAPAAADPAAAAPPPIMEAPPPADPATQVPDTSAGPGKHGRGHAYGHEKQDD
jgi:hypothetical protein